MKLITATAIQTITAAAMLHGVARNVSALFVFTTWFS
jgi:hypothetical protein